LYCKQNEKVYSACHKNIYFVPVVDLPLIDDPLGGHFIIVEICRDFFRFDRSYLIGRRRFLLCRGNQMPNQDTRDAFICVWDCEDSSCNHFLFSFFAGHSLRRLSQMVYVIKKRIEIFCSLGSRRQPLSRIIFHCVDRIVFLFGGPLYLTGP
jgi:hypothetical protein